MHSIKTHSEDRQREFTAHLDRSTVSPTSRVKIVAAPGLQAKGCCGALPSHGHSGVEAHRALLCASHQDLRAAVSAFIKCVIARPSAIDASQ